MGCPEAAWARHDVHVEEQTYVSEVVQAFQDWPVKLHEYNASYDVCGVFDVFLGRRRWVGLHDDQALVLQVDLVYVGCERDASRAIVPDEQEVTTLSESLDLVPGS
jgi:hypothetical protein